MNNLQKWQYNHENLHKVQDQNLFKNSNYTQLMTKKEKKINLQSGMYPTLFLVLFTNKLWSKVTWFHKEG